MALRERVTIVYMSDGDPVSDCFFCSGYVCDVRNSRAVPCGSATIRVSSLWRLSGFYTDLLPSTQFWCSSRARWNALFFRQDDARLPQALCRLFPGRHLLRVFSRSRYTLGRGIGLDHVSSMFCHRRQSSGRSQSYPDEADTSQNIYYFGHIWMARLLECSFTLQWKDHFRHIFNIVRK